MKKVLKLKKIRNAKTKTKRTLRKKRNAIFWKKMFLQIESPHNTNDFLINFNSSPFWNSDEDNEDEISWEMIPSNPIKFKSDTNCELDTFGYKEEDSTDEKTIVLNCKNEQEKRTNPSIFK